MNFTGTEKKEVGEIPVVAKGKRASIIYPYP